MRNPKNITGTRFGKAAVPQAAKALRLDDRIIGQNPRKQKLTEASGTNPMKLGEKELKGAPDAPNTSSVARVPGGLGQDAAPYKHDVVKYPFSVGGPGFPPPQK